MEAPGEIPSPSSAVDAQSDGRLGGGIFLISFVVILVAAILMLRDARREPARRPVEEPLPARRIAGS